MASWKVLLKTPISSKAVEAGAPQGLEIDSWTGLLAPRGASPEIARRISDAVAKALAEPDVKQRFRALGLETAPTPPAEMANIIRSELVRYGDIIKRTGIKSE